MCQYHSRGGALGRPKQNPSKGTALHGSPQEQPQGPPQGGGKRPNRSFDHGETNMAITTYVSLHPLVCYADFPQVASLPRAYLLQVVCLP